MVWLTKPPEGIDGIFLVVEHCHSNHIFVNVWSNAVPLPDLYFDSFSYPVAYNYCFWIVLVVDRYHSNHVYRSKELVFQRKMRKFIISIGNRDFMLMLVVNSVTQVKMTILVKALQEHRRSIYFKPHMLIVWIPKTYC